MKKADRLLLGLSLLAMTFLLSSCRRENLANENVEKRVEKAQKIVWGVKFDTLLFGLMDIETRQPRGFDIDIARVLTKNILGDADKAEFVEVTSKSRIPLLKNGNIDAIIATMTINSERKKVVDFSDVYFNAGQALLVKRGSQVHSIKDLNKKTTVLAVKGSASTENIRKLAPEARVLELESYAECFTALKSGQGVAMTTDNAILIGLSSKNPDYVVTGHVFTKEPYGIAVNKGQNAFLKKLNQALAKIKKNGDYQRIYNKWFAKILK